MKRRFSFLTLVVALAGAGHAVAESPWQQQDFTFKRIKVPEAGAGKRITVQIDDSVQWPPPPVKRDREKAGAEEGAAVSVAAAAAAPAPQADLTNWFWQGVSPLLSDSGPGRLALAVSQLRRSPEGQGIGVPRMQTLQDIATRHGTDILKATIGTRVSPALVLAVIGVESSGRTQAVSSAGAQGLMQLMPATAERFGVEDVNDPAQNIAGGVAYLDWLMKEFDNDPILALAGYNAGENAVKRNGGVPPFAETRAYVPKVISAWTVARGLCRTPPELATDGCVFGIRTASR
ncbi:Soluble lytic murein transglycosylase precursor [Pseudoruegeria aquimaris]|uniref:Soluble lytic murein transglycosylase n=1 Tax=Pseudoruegeria aquimaris TaxID=393663 RepID=A0A1Y5TDQ1_9RHOB|nr:lytic transglycosylase domain-containing protein [Pseudoruegeria aquimaris]SLN58023.1 Soluble lytic murein transglycosylase precursor [Pseudoruegeria aquimaris]